MREKKYLVAIRDVGIYQFNSDDARASFIKQVQRDFHNTLEIATAEVFD